MTKFLASLCAALLLAACQTAPLAQTSTTTCPSNKSAQQAICLNPAWVLDAVVDGEEEKSKVMVVLTMDGINALKAQTAALGTLPVALQVGFYTFESYNAQSLTSGFLVLKPFNSRAEASHVVETLSNK